MKRWLIVPVLGLALLALSPWARFWHTDPSTAANRAYHNGEYDQALVAYQQAAHRTSSPAAVAANEGAALYRLQRYSEAADHYQRAAEGERERSVRAAYDRGNSLLQEATGKGQPDAALLSQAAQQYRTCLQQEPGALTTDARHNLEVAKLLLAQHELAAKKEDSADQPQTRDPAQLAALSQPEEQCPT